MVRVMAKPVEAEAVQWDGTNEQNVLETIHAFENKFDFSIECGESVQENTLLLISPEFPVGVLPVQVGMWVIYMPSQEMIGIISDDDFVDGYDIIVE